MSTGQYDEKLGCSYCLKFIVIRYSISDRDTSTRSCHTFYFHNTGLEEGGPSFFPRYFSHLFTDIYCSVRQLQWRTHLDIDLPYYHCSQNSEPQPLSRVNLGIVSKFHFKHTNLSVSPWLFQENGEIWILTLIWHSMLLSESSVKLETSVNWFILEK